MGLSNDFKLPIVQAYYGNAQSQIATKRYLIYHSEWSKEARGMGVNQITRVVDKFQSRYTLIKLPIKLKKILVF